MQDVGFDAPTTGGNEDCRPARPDHRARPLGHRAESDFAETTFRTRTEEEEPGAAYVLAVADRHEASVHLRFLLRTVFLPPAALKNAIGEAYERFLGLLRERFGQQLRAAAGGRLSALEIARYEQAYIGIVESLFVELTYAGRASMESRRDALWQLLRDSLP